MEHYLSAKRQPSTRGELNQKAHDLADVNCSRSIDETAADAEIFDSALVSASNAMPISRKVDPYALFRSSFVGHRLKMFALP